MTKKIVTYEREDKLPEWATPQVLKTMHQEGKSFRKIGVLVGVSRETVRQLILKAKETPLV